MDATALSLRDQERCFSLLSLALRTTQPGTILWPMLLSVLIVIKVHKPSVFETLSESPFGTATLNVFRTCFQSSRLAPLYAQHLVTVAEAQLIETLDHPGRDEAIADLERVVGTINAQPQEKERCAKILEIRRQLSIRYDGVSLDYFLAKIDLVAQLAS